MIVLVKPKDHKIFFTIYFKMYCVSCSLVIIIIIIKCIAVVGATS